MNNKCVKQKHFNGSICYYYGVIISIRMESDSDIRKTRNVFKNLRFCGKINKYIETLIFTRLKAFYSQIVTFKMVNSSPRFGVDHHFLYGFSFFPRAWLLPGMQISSINLWRVADTRALFIESLWLITEGGEYTCWFLFLGISTRWSPDVWDTVNGRRFNERPFSPVP